MKRAVVVSAIMLVLISIGCAAIAADSGEAAAFKLHVRTDDAGLNRVLDRIYNDCFAGRLRDPAPPCLPFKFFSPGGGYPECQTLWDTVFVSNFYAPWGDPDVLKGLFESYFYAIDHNPEAPKGSYRYGMVPCSLYKEHKSAFVHFPMSQIPMLASGCLMVYRQTGDRAFLEHALPYLTDFDHWYSTERDVDGDGLIEYGAYRLDEMCAAAGVDIVQNARYETFDWHSTLDNMKLTKHPKRPDSGEWYGNVEGVEQTCFLLMSERAIAEAARELGKDDLSARYEKIADRRAKAVQTKMWNPQTTFFHSLDRDSDKQIPDRTIQAFLTLAAGAATREQAAALVEHLRDPKQFWCAYPVPTQAMDDPKYSSAGVWRGDVWPATNYMVAYGLNRYGYHDLAREITNRTLQLITRNESAQVNERYNGVTGEATGGPGLQMSCVVALMMIQDTFGVQADFRTIVVPPKPTARKLIWGKLEVSYNRDNEVELRSGFKREFRIVLPQTAAHASVRCGSATLSLDEVTTKANAITFTAEAGRTYSVSWGT
jgi:neutral trehalase